MMGVERLTPVSRPSATRTSTLNGGPFPPPALPGFDGTTGLSATSGRPACPSRASGWWSNHHSPRLPVFRMPPRSACCRPYPGETIGGFVHPHLWQWPSPRLERVGSRMTLFEADRRSLALRPADSRNRFPILSTGGFDRFVTSPAAPVATG